MDDVKHVTELAFGWVVKVGGMLLAFMFAWLGKIQLAMNKADKALAVNGHLNNGTERRIHEIELSIIQIKKSMEDIKLLFADMKEMYNRTEGQRQQQAKIINDLLD